MSTLESAFVPQCIRHLALSITALGLATLASTQPQLWWQISAISFGLVANVLIGWVIVEHLRRRR